MQFIEQMRAFDKMSDENLTPTAIAVYLKLFMANNRTGWKEWFSESDFWLGRSLGIKRHETITAAINLLKQKGFIDYRRGKAKKPTEYKIIVLINSTIDSTNHSTIHSTIDSTNHSTKDSTNHSTKHSTNPRLRQKTKTKTKTETGKHSTRARAFVPPTLDEVNAYVLERGLHVTAKEFWDYFDAGKWHDSKGNPVKSWKQKILTWEKYKVKELSTKQSTGNPQDDIDRAIEFFQSQEGGENDEGRSDFAGY